MRDHACTGLVSPGSLAILAKTLHWEVKQGVEGIEKVKVIQVTSTSCRERAATSNLLTVSWKGETISRDLQLEPKLCMVNVHFIDSTRRQLVSFEFKIEVTLYTLHDTIWP